MQGFFDIVLTIVGWLSLPLFGFSVWMLVRSVKRDMRLRMRMILLPLLTTVLVPIVYTAILKLDPPKWLAGSLFVIGLAVGFLWANTTTLTLREGEVFGKRSAWYLLVWGVTVGLTQFLSLVAGKGVVEVGLSAVYLSVGIALGTNTNLLFRRSQVKAGNPDAPIGPTLGRKARPQPEIAS